MLAFVTSKGTLDKVNSSLRGYLADKVDFIGAIRLPNTAFKRNANTEVTTDIVFLRKLAAGERPSGPAWLNLAEHANRDGAVFQINEYLAANPHMMLGYMANAGTMYRSNEPALVADDRDLSAALAEAVAALPQGIYRSAERNISEPNRETIIATDDVKENAFALHDGVITIRTGSTLTPVANLPDETARRIRGLIRVRGAVREVLHTQLADRTEDEIVEARRQLNSFYDHFVSRFGAINDSPTVAPSAAIRTCRFFVLSRITTTTRNARRRPRSFENAPFSDRSDGRSQNRHTMRSSFRSTKSDASISRAWGRFYRGRLTSFSRN